MTHRSLRFRLTAWYAGIFAAVFLGLGVLLCIQLRDDLSQILLATQMRRAQQIGETLVARVGTTGEVYVAHTVAALYVPEQSDRFICISRPDGRPLYRSGPPSEQNFNPGLVGPPPPRPAAEFTREEKMPDGRSLLIAAQRVNTPQGDYLVEVGTPAEPVQTLLRRLALLLGLGIPIVILAAAGGGYILVSRSLRPVAEMADAAEVITQHNLTERIAEPRTGDELERLAVAFNRMIARLDDAFQTSKRFVADASHELRTPLTVLRAELEQLVAAPPLPAELADRLGSLLEEVERLALIVEKLLALSRLDAGESQAEWVRFDLGELAASTTDQLRLLAEDRQLTLTVAAKPAFVSGDRARLKQVVVNLLDNAIKYTPPGGAIHVTVGSAGGFATLEVADTGAGIPPEEQPHIFKRFYRADRSRTRDPDGAGLGLAIVQSICSAHRGTVEVHSARARGSRFLVKLPAAETFPSTS